MSEYSSDIDSDSESTLIEGLIQKAFSEADPTASLLQIVQEHTTYDCIVLPVVRYYIEALKDDPSRGHVLACALAKLDTLSSDINRRLDWVLFDDNLEESKSYGPQSRFLFHSLLSGLSFKYRLTGNKTMLMAILKGLDPQGVDYFIFNSQNAEVLVVGACIQLLTHGFVIATEGVGPYRRAPDVIARSLKEQKAEGIVKDPRALHVLELAITHAENDLMPETERNDVWDLLFPTKSGKVVPDGLVET